MAAYIGRSLLVCVCRTVRKFFFYPIRQSFASYLKLANDHLYPRAFHLFTIQRVGQY